MPEAPEVEILKNEATAQLVGRRVKAVAVKKSEKGRLEDAGLLPKLRGARVAGVRRFGKLLVLDFSGDVSLLVHFMLSGQMVLLTTGQGPARGWSLAITFDDGSTLDIRQVALKYLHLIPSGEAEHFPQVAEQGPDILSPEFTLERFRALLKGKRGAIKPLLIDQRFIAGVGNTLVDEALFSAGIHPEHNVATLRPEQVEAIYQQILATARRAMEYGGSSTEQFLHLDGSMGHYQEHFLVNRKPGRPCPRCGTPIEHSMTGGRSTYFCPHCQTKD